VAKWVFLAGPWIFSALGLASELVGKAGIISDEEGIVPLFSLSHEGNLPTLFQVCVLLACAAMLALIARAEKAAGGRWHRQWRWLALGFAFIALDEWSSIHELFNALLDFRGVLFFGWILPYGIVALVAGIAFIPFVLARPRRVRIRFLLAGTIYVAGAIGMELPLGWWTDQHGMDNLGYALLDWGEETLELIGAGLFGAAVFDVLRGSVASLRLDVPGPAGGAEA
jgi:hypothetical protein